MSVTTNLTTLTDADASTGFSELAAPHASGAAPALDEENYIQNNTLPASVSQASGQASGTSAGFQYTHGSTFTLNNSNDVVIAWTYYAAPTNILSWSSGGGRLGIGTEDNLKTFNAMGNNFGTYPYGGWQSTAIDPDLTSDFDIGSPAGTTFDSVCFLPNVTTKITKGTPIGMDVIRYGRGDIIATGTETFTSMAAANDAIAARWGLFRAKGGGTFAWKGLMQLGTAATSLSITESNVTIEVEDTPRVSAGFNKIEINNAGTSINCSSVTIKGITTSITGSAPVSPGDVEVINCAASTLPGWTFSDLGTISLHSNITLTTPTFRQCKAVTQNGSTLTGGSIVASEDTSALIADNIDLVTGVAFKSTATTGYHAVNLGNFAIDTTVSWNNTLVSVGTEWDGSSGTTAGVSGTANDAILVDVDATKTLTIDVVGGSVPNVQNVGAGTVIIQSSVTVSVLVYEDDGSTPLVGASVYIKLTAGDGSTEILNGITNGSGILSAGYGGAVPVSIDSSISEVRSSSGVIPYQNYTLGGQITSSGYSATAIMQVD